VPTLGTAHATLTSATPTPAPTATPAASSSATATSSAAAGGCAGLDGTLQPPERRAQRCLHLRRIPPLGGHLREGVELLQKLAEPLVIPPRSLGAAVEGERIRQRDLSAVAPLEGGAPPVPRMAAEMAAAAAAAAVSARAPSYRRAAKGGRPATATTATTTATAAAASSSAAAAVAGAGAAEAASAADGRGHT